MEKLKTVGIWILLIYFALGVGLSIYMDYELISDKGIWAYLFRGDNHGMYHVLLWPFYL